MDGQVQIWGTVKIRLPLGPAHRLNCSGVGTAAVWLMVGEPFVNWPGRSMCLGRCNWSTQTWSRLQGPACC